MVRARLSHEPEETLANDDPKTCDLKRLKRDITEEPNARILRAVLEGATPARLQRLSLYLQFEVAGPTGKGGRGAPLTWST